MFSFPRHITAPRTAWAAFALTLALVSVPASAQQFLSPPQLDSLVSRIALYPDPLLAQVMTGSTYYDQIPDAARWAVGHNYLNGEELGRAIANDNLPWDPSVQALLPFPTVLDTMARDMDWTRHLGDAVLAQRPDVMDAIQRMRHQAYSYGYVRDCPQYRVINSGPIIEIVPYAPGAIFVPMYDPYRVYAAPRPGVFVGLSFGPRIFIGASFGAYGWREPRFDWRQRVVVIDNRPWGRTYSNRTVYVHEYAAPLAIRHYNEHRDDRRPEFRNDRRPEVRDERRPEVHNDRRPEVHTEARPEARPEVRNEVRPAPRPEARPEAAPRRDSQDVRPSRPDRTDHSRDQRRKDEKKDVKKDEKRDEHKDDRK